MCARLSVSQTLSVWLSVHMHTYTSHTHREVDHGMCDSVPHGEHREELSVLLILTPVREEGAAVRRCLLILHLIRMKTWRAVIVSSAPWQSLKKISNDSRGLLSFLLFFILFWNETAEGVWRCLHLYEWCALPCVCMDVHTTHTYSPTHTFTLTLPHTHMWSAYPVHGQCDWHTREAERACACIHVRPS